MIELSGIFAALTTPFDPEGAVSLTDLKHNIHRFNGTDLSGYVVLGSTGESVLLSRAEAEGILVAVKESAAKQKKLIAGTGAESTAETIERTKRAAEIGYEVALVKTPYYYKPSYKPEVLIAHYRRVADASPIPVLLYSVPQFTGVALEAAEVAELAAHPNIMGIKDSSGNVQRIGEIIAGTPPKFQVLVGLRLLLARAVAFLHLRTRFLRNVSRCSSLFVTAITKKRATFSVYSSAHRSCLCPSAESLA
jgi:4-hydroxy-2-oxoglutarate aldolase